MHSTWTMKLPVATPVTTFPTLRLWPNPVPGPLWALPAVNATRLAAAIAAVAPIMISLRMPCLLAVAVSTCER